MFCFHFLFTNALFVGILCNAKKHGDLTALLKHYVEAFNFFQIIVIFFVFSGFARYDAVKKSNAFSSALHQRMTIKCILTCASNCNANFQRFQR